LGDELIEHFNRVLAKFQAGRWEETEMAAGKFCEVAYTILRGHVDGSFPKRASKPSNMYQACKDLEQADSSKFGRAVRVQIPRVIISIYEIRNNRGVGHVGGDVDPNHMDAMLAATSVKWIMADLVRVFHATDIGAASQLAESLIERTTPIVWEVKGARRVLVPGLDAASQLLILFNQADGPVPEAELREWVEYRNGPRFRSRLLGTLHKSRLIEYDSNAGTVTISPLGRVRADGIVRERKAAGV